MSKYFIITLPFTIIPIVYVLYLIYTCVWKYNKKKENKNGKK